jgi:hypothetical protein
VKVEHERIAGCGGTGIYCGFMEPKGVGVVCVGCGGTGKQTSTFRAFLGRRKRRGVRWVHRSAGTFIATGVGPLAGRVAYKDFLKGKMP